MIALNLLIRDCASGSENKPLNDANLQAFFFADKTLPCNLICPLRQTNVCKLAQRFQMQT